jgi:hypothetical protein
MDNTNLLSFETLKKTTFKDIFKTTNKEANSLKKPLNYINYSKEDHNVINKLNKSEHYSDFEK